MMDFAPVGFWLASGPLISLFTVLGLVTIDRAYGDRVGDFFTAARECWTGDGPMTFTEPDVSDIVEVSFTEPGDPNYGHPEIFDLQGGL